MLMCAKRLKVLDVDFVTSSVAETDALDGPTWSSGTAYVIGDRVRRSTTNFHRSFECVQAHTNKTPEDPANVGPTAFWVLVAWTHRWRVFDDSQSQQSLTEDGEDWNYWRMYSPEGQIVSHIALFNGAANIARITKMAYQTAYPSANALSPNSEGFASSDWTQLNLTLSETNTEADPETLVRVADVFEETTATGVHSITWAGVNTDFVSGRQYTASIFVKRKSGSRNLRLRLPTTAFAANTQANFTLDGAGSAVFLGSATAASISNAGLPAGWYRCSVTATAVATSSQPFMVLQFLDAVLNNNYTGSTSQRLVFHGANLSESSSLLSYRFCDQTASYIRTVLKTHSYDYNAIRYLGAAPHNPDCIAVTGSFNSNDQYEVAMEQGTPDLLPRIAEIVMLYDAEELGELITPLDESLLDFSSKERDTFGNVTLIPRNAASDISYTFKTDRANRSRIKNVLQERVGIPLVFWDDEDPDNLLALMQFGFITDYSMPLSNSDAQFVTLGTEGLN